MTSPPDSPQLRWAPDPYSMDVDVVSSAAALHTNLPPETHSGPSHPGALFPALLGDSEIFLFSQPWGAGGGHHRLPSGGCC